MDNTPYKSFEVIQRTKSKKVCEQKTDVVKHSKLMPECRNVTKQNCITKWETDAYGKQQWAGNEACEPVTWKECKLVPKQVDFKVPKITCDEEGDIPYDDYIDVEKSQMISRMTCEVKHTTSCEPKVTNKCKDIQFQECNEVPDPQCKKKEVKIPKQEKEHKKKCLLADDDSLPSSATSAPAPNGFPTPSPTVYTNEPVNNNVISQPSPASPQPTFPAAPQPAYTVTAAPSSSYGVPRAGRLTTSNFGSQRQQSNNGFGRRPKSFRQGNFQNFNGQFRG
jgi:hypothetical protein